MKLKEASARHRLATSGGRALRANSRADGTFSAEAAAILYEAIHVHGIEAARKMVMQPTPGALMTGFETTKTLNLGIERSASGSPPEAPPCPLLSAFRRPSCPPRIASYRGHPESGERSRIDAVSQVANVEDG